MIQKDQYLIRNVAMQEILENSLPVDEHLILNRLLCACLWHSDTPEMKRTKPIPNLPGSVGDTDDSEKKIYFQYLYISVLKTNRDNQRYHTY